MMENVAASVFVARFRDRLVGAQGDWDTLGDGAGAWTGFMTKIFHDVAEQLGLACYCESPAHKAAQRREYLWDMTWYPLAHGEHALPEVVIEHENSHHSSAFMADFWKVMAAFAPLRVMVGYARKNEAINGLKDAIRREAPGWHFPPESSDVVILKRYQPRVIDWATWVASWQVLVRPSGAIQFEEYPT